jgi:hypothetical protein
MIYLLLIMTFSGQMETVHYQTEAACESALMERVDGARMKDIQVAECIDTMSLNVKRFVK